MRVVSRAVPFSFVSALSIHPLDTVHQSYPNIPDDSNSTVNRGSRKILFTRVTDFFERNRFPRRRWSSRKFSRKFHSIFSLSVDPIPTSIAFERRVSPGVPNDSDDSHVRIRAYTSVHAQRPVMI